MDEDMDMSGAPAYAPQPDVQPQGAPQMLDDGRKMLYVLSPAPSRASSVWEARLLSLSLPQQRD